MQIAAWPDIHSPIPHVIRQILNREEWYCDLCFYLMNVLGGGGGGALPHPNQNSSFRDVLT